MSLSALFMSFPGTNYEVTFLKRPQRFLAEMVFPQGDKFVAYCANSGALNGCLDPGSLALVWDSADPKRKRRYTWIC